jgi:hypothetical protein
MRLGGTFSITAADLERLPVRSTTGTPHERLGTNAIMRETGKSKTCSLAGSRPGLEGLLRDKTRPSRILKLDAAIAERIVALSMEPRLAEATQGTCAAMAEAVAVSVSSVQRIWRAHGLQLHRVWQFKLPRDPALVDKLRDVVGLYVGPPAHVLVLSVDETSEGPRPHAMEQRRCLRR